VTACGIAPLELVLLPVDPELELVLLLVDEVLLVEVPTPLVEPPGMPLLDVLPGWPDEDPVLEPPTTPLLVALPELVAEDELPPLDVDDGLPRLPEELDALEPPVLLAAAVVLSVPSVGGGGDEVPPYGPPSGSVLPPHPSHSVANNDAAAAAHSQKRNAMNRSVELSRKSIRTMRRPRGSRLQGVPAPANQADGVLGFRKGVLVDDTAQWQYSCPPSSGFRAALSKPAHNFRPSNANK
jgi:hypothetical protein